MSSIIFFGVLVLTFYACWDYRKTMKKEEEKLNEKNKSNKDNKNNNK